jgi:hypothetical protein
VWTFLSSWRTEKGIRASEAGAPERERVTAREREKERKRIKKKKCVSLLIFTKF